MQTVIYWDRTMRGFDEELAEAQKLFPVLFRRTAIPPGSLVIPRYSALPKNRELCEDIDALGSRTINTYEQHCYVADLRNWYYDLGEITPRTWFALDQIPNEGPFVLKGQTNSKKHQWNTHMFANTKREAAEVYYKLAIDGHVGAQQIYIRQYVPLKKLCDGLNGLPISEEYRFFILDGRVVSAGFYWSSHTEELEEQGIELSPWTSGAKQFVEKVIALVGNKCRFWVVDIARTVNDQWLVVELNDGQQAGLSDIHPEEFYTRLKHRLST